MGTNIKNILEKLDSIDMKLTTLSAQIARIEKELGIKQPKPAIKKKASPKDSKGKKTINDDLLK